MKELRKCFVESAIWNKEERKYKDAECYFHEWSREGAKKIHPEDPQKDHVYSYLIGIVEVIATGKVIQTSPESITFLD